MTSSRFTRRKADRHEALYVRFARLAKQIEAIALRHPDLPVPEATRIIAEALFYDLGAFLPAQRSGLRPVPPAMAGLASELSQALAALDVFEAANSQWHPEHKARIWCVDGDPYLVRRLKPNVSVRIRDSRQEAYSSRIREQLIHRMIAKQEEAYEAGYADAQAGNPMRESRL